MSNNITIELCAEDRARIDRLAAAMEARTAQVEDIIAGRAERQEAETVDLDEVQQKLAEAMAKASAPAEAPKNAPEEAKAETLTTEPQTEEKPVAKEDAPAEPAKPTVTLEQIQQKVVQLAAGQGGAKKAKVREIINGYGTKVSDLKDQPDKWDEVWDKLCKLESEG